MQEILVQGEIQSEVYGHSRSEREIVFYKILTKSFANPKKVSTFVIPNGKTGY